MSTLVNKELETIGKDVDKFKESLQEAFYNQFKGANKLVNSLNYEGKTADSFKSYIGTVTMNFINDFINVSEEMNSTFNVIKEAFFSYETSSKGIVEESTLDDVFDELSHKKNGFDSLLSDIEKLTRQAAEYISIKTLGSAAVESDYQAVNKKIQKIKEELQSTDDKMLKTAEMFEQKIDTLLTNINRITDEYYNGVRINYPKVSQVTQEDWFTIGDTEILLQLRADDPFHHISGRTSVWEDYARGGLSSDVYGYIGGRYRGAEGEWSSYDNVWNGNGNFSFFEAHAYGQLTDWARLKGDGYILGANGEIKFGWNEDYKGFKLEGEAAVAKGEISATIGGENCNAYIQGSAELLSVDGYAVCEFEDRNNFDIGIGGSATAASAQFSMGFSILNVDIDDGNKDKNSDSQQSPLLGISGGPSYGVGAGARITNQNVYEGNIVNVNATTVSIEGCLGIGGSIDITVPTISFNFF